jgi:hypothetical protein
MAFTVADFEVRYAKALIPEFGVWSVFARLVGDKAPPQGERAAIQLGNLALSGTVRLSEVYVGRAEVLVVAGGDGWGRSVQMRPYRADNGVRLATVAGDLARDAGEVLGPLGELQEAKLGYAWIRPEGLASHALDELGYPWWLALDGTTRLGERPLEVIEGAALGVVSYQPSLRVATLTSPTDELSLFLPGTILLGEGIPQLPIRGTTVTVTSRSAAVEVQIA